MAYGGPPSASSARIVMKDLPVFAEAPLRDLTVVHEPVDLHVCLSRDHLFRTDVYGHDSGLNIFRQMLVLLRGVTVPAMRPGWTKTVNNMKTSDALQDYLKLVCHEGCGADVWYENGKPIVRLHGGRPINPEMRQPETVGELHVLDQRPVNLPVHVEPVLHAAKPIAKQPCREAVSAVVSAFLSGGNMEDRVRPLHVDKIRVVREIRFTHAEWNAYIEMRPAKLGVPAHETINVRKLHGFLRKMDFDPAGGYCIETGSDGNVTLLQVSSEEKRGEQ